MSERGQQWRQALEPTPDCIAIDRLGDERTEAERAHLATCPRCQTELALFDQFRGDPASADELRDGQWIAAELQRRFAAPSNVKAFRPRFGAFSGLAAAAALVLVIGTAWWLENREPSLDSRTPTGSVYRSARLEAIAPAGDLPEAPRGLQWTAVPGATSYAVELREVDRTLLWSGSTTHTSIDLPANVIALFLPGKTLLWEVTARRGSQVLAASGIQRFRVALRLPRRPQP